MLWLLLYFLIAQRTDWQKVSFVSLSYKTNVVPDKNSQISLFRFPAQTVRTFVLPFSVAFFARTLAYMRYNANFMADFLVPLRFWHHQLARRIISTSIITCFVYVQFYDSTWHHLNRLWNGTIRIAVFGWFRLVESAQIILHAQMTPGVFRGKNICWLERNMSVCYSDNLCLLWLRTRPRCLIRHNWICWLLV